MESQPQNPEFRIDPQNFLPSAGNSLDNLKINPRSYYNLPNSAF